MRRNSIIALASLAVLVLAALIYGSARVTGHMQPERRQPVTNADKGADRDSRAPDTTGAIPPDARPATPSSGRDVGSGPGAGNAGNVPAGPTR